MKYKKELSTRNKIRLGFIIAIALIALFTFVLSLRQITYGFIRDLNVMGDAYVHEYYPDTNYGKDDYLFVGDHHLGKVEAYYYFDVSSFRGDWVEVDINVYFDYASSPADVGGRITSNNWDETTITWNNKPSHGKYVGHIWNDGFAFRIPLKPEDFIDGIISICLYGREGDYDGYIRAFVRSEHT